MIRKTLYLAILIGAISVDSIGAVAPKYKKAHTVLRRSKYKARSCIKGTAFKNRYITILSGLSVPEGSFNKALLPSKYKAAPLASLAFGFKTSRHFNTELSVVYRGRYKLSYFDTSPTAYGIWHNKLENISFFINEKIILRNGKIFSPYVIGGVGLAINKMYDFSGGKRKECPGPGISYYEKQFGKVNSDFTWQAGIGALIKLSRVSQLDIGYRFVKLGKYISSDTVTQGCDSQLPLNSTGDRLYGGRIPITGRQSVHDFTVGLTLNF